MDNLLYFYQHIPSYINPTFFSLGPFSVQWYSLMYLIGFATVYFLLARRTDRESEYKSWKKLWLPFLLYVFFGLIIGARLGYAFFYNFHYYWQNPLAVISPFEASTGKFIGLYGMSYHGGLLGATIAGIFFARKYKLNFWKLANFVAPAIPAGYFFGRIGNFFNGELYGRVTRKFWGMYFPSSLETSNFLSPELRHPSQLYEALLEGLILFIILWTLKNNDRFKNKLFIFYLGGYALARIFIEFFRQPDSQIGYIGGFLTLGQILSFFMLFLALALLFYGKKNEKVLKYKE